MFGQKVLSQKRLYSDGVIGEEASFVVPPTDLVSGCGSGCGFTTSNLP